MSSDGSRPNSVGALTIPLTRVRLSTKSIMRQSVFPVFGERRMPRPICMEAKQAFADLVYRLAI
jgi:hypothetical protein